MATRLAAPIDLAHSLQGGQAFLWSRERDAFSGVVERAPAVLRQVGTHAEIVEGDAATLARYFRVEPEDAARRKRLLRDPALADTMRALPGLRLLRQDPWETTVAFLTSANNNVLRIEGTMKGFAKKHGAFPSPAQLARATEPGLRKLGLGYRAPFLRETARMIARGDVDLDALRGASHADARETLLQLPGVGPKVADCIALFSLDVDDAFPMDRWMARACAEAFGREMTLRDAADAARERWGRDAGLAQQYLFHSVRLRAAGAPGAARLR